MPDKEKSPFDLQTREYTLREASVDTDKGIISGIAVPYESPVRIREWWGDEYDEQFARGSVDDEGALAFWRHADPIGYMASSAEAETGRSVDLKISETTLGRDVLTLARDLKTGGRAMQMSVGFEPGGDFTVEERDDDVPLVTRTRTRVREISLVPFGAYGEGASVTEVREDRKRKEQPMPNATATADPADLIQVRESVEELERRFDALPPASVDTSPTFDTRSAAEFVQALARGDADTIEVYNRSQEHLHDELQTRAYTGGTTADAPVQDGWVGDLTRIFDASSGVLSQIFSTGTLPATGMNIEYAQLLANTVQVTEQSAQGDDLDTGKVTLETKTAAVKTYGGYTQLSRQQIERSTLPVLNRSLEALAVAAGARKKAVLRAAVAAAVSAREGIAANAGVVLLGAVLGSATAGNWEDALVDAAIKYDGLDASPDAMVVSATVFKKLRSLTVSGERVFQVHDKNASGTLNLPGLTGNLAGLPVYLDAGQAGDKAYFANGTAIRQYDSALVSLQDENIINLSKDFSVYRFGAVAAEVPQLIVPVKLAAS